MQLARPSSLACILASILVTIHCVAASAQTVTPLCTPKVLANQVVATPAQRETARDIAQPPLTDTGDGFAWPDTPIGIIKTDRG
jgi:hypothetical protein